MKNKYNLDFDKYTYVDDIMIYRIDKQTGRTEMYIGRGDWEEKEPYDFNALDEWDNQGFIVKPELIDIMESSMKMADKCRVD